MFELNLTPPSTPEPQLTYDEAVDKAIGHIKTSLNLSKNAKWISEDASSIRDEVRAVFIEVQKILESALNSPRARTLHFESVFDELNLTNDMINSVNVKTYRTALKALEKALKPETPCSPRTWRR